MVLQYEDALTLVNSYKPRCSHSITSFHSRQDTHPHINISVELMFMSGYRHYIFTFRIGSLQRQTVSLHTRVCEG